jgi:hypothetical protein
MKKSKPITEEDNKDLIRKYSIYRTNPVRLFVYPVKHGVGFCINNNLLNMNK